jgi:hypothetical protein
MRALILLCCLSGAVLAQAPAKPVNIPAPDTGSQLFRGLLNLNKIEPVTLKDVRGNGFDSSNLIVICIGNPISPQITNIIRSTLSRGGAVLYVDAGPNDVSQLFPSAADVKIVQNDAFEPNANTNGECNIVPLEPNAFDQVAQRGGLMPLFDIFNGFDKIESNPMSALQITTRPKELARNIAEYPPTIRKVDAQRRQTVVQYRTVAAAGAGDARNPYRCLFIADLYLFSNFSLYTSGRAQNPTDNLKFANRTVQWLQGDVKRTKCLFLENGRENTKFDEFEFSSIPLNDMPPLPDAPLPEINPFDEEFQRKIADSGNEMLDDFQNKDPEGEIMDRNIYARREVYTAFAVVAAIIGYLMLRRRAVLGNNHKADYRPRPRDPQQLGPQVIPGGLGHRKLELLRSSNYGPMFREFTLRLFNGRGLPTSFDKAKLPKVVYDVKRPDYLKEAMAAVWKALNSTKPVSYSDWKVLEPYLNALDMAAADNRWWFDGWQQETPA